MMKWTLSAIVLSGALLAGCGGGTTVVSRTETPTGATTSASTTPSGEPVASASATASASASPVQESVAASPAPAPPPTTDKLSTPASPSTVPVAPPATTAPAVPVPSTPTSQPTQPPTAPAAAGEAWAVMDVTVTTAAGADRLAQTSADFRAFVAQRVAAPDASGCQSELTVQSFHPDGFAAGQDFAPGCGGSQNIWGRVGGSWTTIMTMQSIVDCSQMQRNNIPKGLPDIPCLDTNGNLADW